MAPRPRSLDAGPAEVLDSVYTNRWLPLPPRLREHTLSRGYGAVSAGLDTDRSSDAEHEGYAGVTLKFYILFLSRQCAYSLIINIVNLN